MGNKKSSVGESLTGRAGHSVADADANLMTNEKKYGSRIYERFGVNPFDQKKGDRAFTINTAL